MCKKVKLIKIINLKYFLNLYIEANLYSWKDNRVFTEEISKKQTKPVSFTNRNTFKIFMTDTIFHIVYKEPSTVTGFC